MNDPLFGGMVPYILSGLSILWTVWRPTSRKQYCLVQAWAWLASTLIEIWARMPRLACVTAVWAAFFVFLWWINGGGDDTKRRLREFMKKFQAVRRTAPATA